MRVLRGSAFTLPSPVFVGADGETPEDCASTPTCTVSREDGTVLAAATVTSVTTAPGSYTAAITTTHTGQVDRLTVTWTGTSGSLVQVYVDQLEVVGGHYVTIPELRAVLPVSKYPLAALRQSRDDLTDYIELVTGVAYVPRYEREEFTGCGRRTVQLTRARPRALLSVTLDGATVAGCALSPTGQVTSPSALTVSTTGPNVSVAYEHGHLAPSPKLRTELVRAVEADLKSVRTGGPLDQISETADGRTIRYSTPDGWRHRPTGLLVLDAVLATLDESIPGIG